VVAREVVSDNLQLSLEQHPNGLYIIVIETDNQVGALQKVFLRKK
jgi:hypothetical protein